MNTIFIFNHFSNMCTIIDSMIITHNTTLLLAYIEKRDAQCKMLTYRIPHQKYLFFKLN